MKSLSILSVMKELTNSSNSANTSKASEMRGDENAEHFIANDRDGFAGSCSTKMQNLLEEFTKLYTDKLQRVEDLALEDEKEYLLRKVSVLEAWVEDLGEQNSALVSTVEDLEREASQRVELLQEKLDKMASVTKNSCVSLRDQQLEINAIMNQKVLEAENESLMLREKIHNLEKCNGHLLEENASLHSDLERFIEEVSKNSRNSFKVVKNDICRFERQSDEGSSPSRIEFSEKRFSSPSVSIAEDVVPMSPSKDIPQDPQVLQSELIHLQIFNERNTRELIQKDREISHLQAQLSDLEEKLGKTQMQLEETTDALDHLRESARLKQLEFASRNEFNTSLCSQSGRLKSSWRDSQTSSIEIDGMSKVDIEARLSNNIDILAGRLNDLEEECEEMRDQYTSLKATHDLCEPTIDRLQEQLNTSRLSMDELRSVLTSEVAERHDVVLSLRKQLEDLRCQNHETTLQLQMKCDVIRELRRRTKQDGSDEEAANIKKEDAATNTDKEAGGDVSKLKVQKENPEKNASRTSPSSVPQSVQICKLENEIAEKNILIRELQNHLASSRQEINLKDETLVKVEGKLDSTRRNYDEKEDRLHYLKGQLTCLQLEVSRLHGQSQQLKNQLENKSLLVRKLEEENTSLTSQLNERSAMMEVKNRSALQMESKVELLQQEINEQKLTIASLQDALVATKQTCEKLRDQMECDEGNKEPLKGLLEKAETDLQEALKDINLKEEQLDAEHMGLDQLSEALAFERERNLILREKVRKYQGSIVDMDSKSEEISIEQKQEMGSQNGPHRKFFSLEKRDQAEQLEGDSSYLESQEKIDFSNGKKGTTIEFLLLELKSLREELKSLQEKSQEIKTPNSNSQEQKSIHQKTEMSSEMLKNSEEKNECRLCSSAGEGGRKCCCPPPTTEEFCFCQKINEYIKVLLEELQNKIQVLAIKGMLERNRCSSKPSQMRSDFGCRHLRGVKPPGPTALPLQRETLKGEKEADFLDAGGFNLFFHNEDSLAIDEEYRDPRLRTFNEGPILSQKIKDLQKDILESRKHQDRAETSTRAILRRLRQLLEDTSCHSSSSIKSCRSSSEIKMLKQQLAEAKKDLQDEKRLRLLLSNDAQIVIRAVGEWLQHQKEANSLLASKFHQQNRQLLSCSTQKRRHLESAFNVDELESAFPPQATEQDASSLLDNDSGICDNAYLHTIKGDYEARGNLFPEGGRDSSYPADQLDSEVNSMCSSAKSSSHTSTKYFGRKYESRSKTNSIANEHQQENEGRKQMPAKDHLFKSPEKDHQQEGQSSSDTLEKLISDLEMASGLLQCN